MRHLSVPSKETAYWRAELENSNWLSIGYGIHNLGEFRGIPLNDSAPAKIESFAILELPPITTGPSQWTDRLEHGLFEKFRDFWPMSYDQIGEIIILKIPNEIKKYSDQIGKAILGQHPKINSVYADNGINGDFRVRQLELISSIGKPSTLTKVKEHGSEFFVDPTVAYYSPRLANERLKTVETAKRLAGKLGRKITVCDPYAGVGPSVIHLAKLSEVVGDIYASDLNPEAVEILKMNLPNYPVMCEDARNLSKTFPERCDLLLVNLPHNFCNHLPNLLGLLEKGHSVVIKGWTILPSDAFESTKQEILKNLGDCLVEDFNLELIKSYSVSEVLASVELQLILS